jgi:hypothetical protein
LGASNACASARWIGSVYVVALFYGSSAVVGVRLNKNPAELAAAKIVPPPKMFKNYVYSLIESLYCDFVLS